MTIRYPEILGLRSESIGFSWTDREAMLYALGVGMGEDPLDEKQLAFVYERNLQVLPTFASVIVREAAPGPLDINAALVLDGERDLMIHKPLASSASVVMNGRITGVSDKGPGKGAIITREVVIMDACNREKIATMVSSIFARGDGGFGGPPESKTDKPGIPARAPDLTVNISTRPDQALIYRLSGDRNPLHCDPAFAVRAGFQRPILHGLCTYGICCRAILQTYADFDPTAIKRFAARFSSPCYPGDVVSVDIWKSDSELSFQARVEKRGVTVIKNGRALLG